MYSIDVGQGDATFIVTPNRKKILIDGGLNRRALGFLIWRYRLDKPENSVDIDLMVLTHADSDHLKGFDADYGAPQNPRRKDDSQWDHAFQVRLLRDPAGRSRSD
jgi:phosphoribosyl 1,2-cyclic phosphodiesterase